jgi:putative addiction module CopG family antidote
MSISLSPDVERLIAEKVSSGRYESADEVVRQGLELLQEKENGNQKTTSVPTVDLAAMFDAISKDVPATEWERVPSDLSTNLYDYLYGSKKLS